MNMGVSYEEFQFLVEGLTADMIERLVEKENYDLKTAIDTVYSSRTFSAIKNPETGLYYQSPGYVMQYLEQEIKTRMTSSATARNLQHSVTLT